MVLYRLVIIYRRLYRDALAKEEGIAELYARHEVVIARTAMHELCVDTHIQTVFYNIEAASQTGMKLIVNAVQSAMLISRHGKNHPVVCHEISAFRLYAEIQLLRSAIAESDTGKRTVTIILALLKLGICHYRHYKTYDEQKEFFHNHYILSNC